VAVTGLGLLTGLGLDLPSSWQGLVAGRRVAQRFQRFNPDGMRTPFGVELPLEAEALFARSFKPRAASLMNRATKMAVLAAREACAASGLAENVADLSRVGVVIGYTGSASPPEQTREDTLVLQGMANAPAAWISLDGGFTGPAFTVSTACASGAYALHSAYLLIQAGICDLVVAGGSESTLNRPYVDGFSALMTLAEWEGDVTQASRPFDARRCGFVIAEGAGALVLESLEHARARAAQPLALMWEPAVTSEAYNILSPRRDGEGMAITMRRALTLAGLAPTDIAYINAHGTATVLNDLYETQAIKQAFGDSAQRLAVSSTKSMTGHCLSGAAAVEAVICCQAIASGTIPPTINLERPGDGLDLDYVPHTARQASLNHVLCNSFGFGGHNGCTVFSRPPATPEKQR
jgi:3-oxoacyl-[acyl-carrier-protein] synthase II